MNYLYKSAFLLVICCISSSLASFYKTSPAFCMMQKHICEIKVSHKESKMHCLLEREKNIQESRKYYKLTKIDGEKIIRFPFIFIPFMNQTMETVQLHTALDAIDSKWLAQITAFNRVIKEMGKNMMTTFSDTNFTQASDYIDIFRMHNMNIKYLNRPDLFSNPVMYPTFTEFIYKERYLSDDFFVQHRLAGPCPFLLQLVTKNGHNGMRWRKLKRRLNKKFDFDTALRRLLEENEITLDKAVENHDVFVLYHQENNDVTTIKDYFKGTALLNVTSPISLFIRTPSGDLKVFAIQIDYISTSPVYTPNSDEYNWQAAKAMVNLGDLNVCQALWHLSHVHLSSGVYCAIYKSHFSKLHPIHHIMQYHCEGTTPHISLTYELLVAPHKYGTKLFSISNSGYANLAILGHKKFRYETLAYDEIMKSRGLDKLRVKYYPYRDDGAVIWNSLKKFAKSFTNMYYKNDDDVQGDWELQSFAAQISVDGGNGETYGGKGNIIGFPHVFHTKYEIRTFITRFLWQVVMHAAVNYPLEPWGSFIPLNPSKLYRKSTTHKRRTIYDAMPDQATTIGATSFATLLGNVRLNRIFDYHNKLNDEKLQKLVKKYYLYFHNCLQELLEKRNARRSSKDQMGYQYFEPKWLTNSIHV